jgi:heme/copper-type cytochrome/quinol oxidase subunit 2
MTALALFAWTVFVVLAYEYWYRRRRKPDNDPTPWCHGCGAMKQRDCDCGPIADND